MSLQTTLAKAAAENAQQLWRRHRHDCSQCDLAMYRRRYGELCPTGTVALHIKWDLAAQAKREAEADKAPNPNQASLF